MNEYDQILAGGAAGVTEGNEYDRLLEEFEEARRARLRAAAIEAQKTNPDQFARALTLSRETGLPAGVVANHLQEVEEEVRLNEYDRLLEQAPATARWLSNADNAKVAADDVNTLATIEGALTTVADIGRAGAAGGVRAIGSSLAGLGELNEVAARALERGIRAIPGGDTVADFLRNTAIPWWLSPTEILRRPGEDLKEVARTIEPPSERQNLVTDIAGGVGQIVTQIATALLSGGVSSGVTLASLVGQGADIQAERVRQAGTEGTAQADLAILAGGGITAITERYGLEFLLNRVPPKIRNAVFRQLADVALAGGIEAVQEVVEGVLQDLATRALVDPNHPLFEGLDREALAAGGAGAFVRALVNAVTRGRTVAADQAAAERAQHEAQRLNEQAAAARASRLRQRHKEKFEEFVSQAADGAHLYMPVEKAVEFFQSLGPDRGAELARELGVEDQIGDAWEPGSDVVIPVSKYLANIAPDEQLHAAMLPNLRTEPGGWTLSEAEEFNLRVQEIREEEIAAAQAEAEAIAAREAPADRVYEDVRRQLVDAGRGLEVAQQEAALWRAFFNTMAERTGRDAWELYQSFGVQIRGTLPQSLRDKNVDRLDVLIETLRKGVRKSDKQLFGDSLLEFLSKRGGLIDAGGELEDMDADKWHRDKPGRGKLIRRRRGEEAKPGERALSLDEAAHAAWEAGYFPEFGAERPTVADLLEAIDEELRGNPRYSEKHRVDTAAVAERQAVDDLAETLDRLGIDWRTASNEEIKAALNTLSADAEPQEGDLFQAAPPVEGAVFQTATDGGGIADKRGSFRPGEGVNIITLFQKADLSTFLHESGHFFLEAFRHLATRPDAPDQLRADWEKIKSWAGITDDTAAIPVEAHEKFARGFEAYLLEGKAPSEEVRSLFDRFRAWLLNIYRTVTALRVEVTDEIRGVMDRMLATDAAIAEAERLNRYAPLFEDAQAAGMTEAEFRAYVETHNRARKQAEERLLRRAMNEIARERKRWWREERAKIRAQVEREVNARPVYQALYYLQTGKFLDGRSNEGVEHMRLSRDALVQSWGEQVLNMLPRSAQPIFTKQGGVHPDVIAEMFGFRSGDDLVTALLGVHPRVKVIETETDVRMREKYGDILRDGSIEAEAQQAVHGDARAAFLTTELNALNRKIGKREPSPADYARRIAREAINRKAVRDIKAFAYARAEAKAARAAERALAAGDIPEAARQKRLQLLNHMLYIEARKAEEEIEKITNRFNRINRPDEKISKGTDIDYVLAARAILAKFGLSRSDFDFAAWLERVRERDPSMADTLSLAIDAAAQRPQDWRDMPLRDFRALADAVSNLMQTGRNVRTIEVEGKRVELKDVVGELIHQSHDKDSGRRPGLTEAVTEGEKLRVRFLGAVAALTRVEHWARMMDDGKPGAFTKYIVRPVMEAVGRYRDEKKRRLEQLLAILEPRKKELLGKRIDAREIGYTFANKGELLHAILHTGNDSNLEKLLIGRGWGRLLPNGALDRSRWDALIARLIQEGTLTKEDFDTAQAIWDLLEDLKKPAQEAHRRMFGYYFSEITAQPIQTPWGVYRGGYMPAIADRFLIEDGQARADREALEGQQNAAMFPSTGRGFTKKRIDQYRRPLELNLMLIPSHIDKVLRFTYLEPTIRDVGRIANDRQFREHMRGIDPTAVSEMLIPWLQRTARQTVETPATGEAGRALAAAARGLRKRVALQAMAGNLLNAAQQFTGLSSAAVKIPPALLMRALVTYARSPKATAEEIGRKSALMRHRITAATMDLLTRVEDVLVKPTTMDEMRRIAERHGYFLQQGAQNVVDVIVWLAAYEQATRNGMSDADAVYEADATVRQTQGSFAPEDISRFEAGPAWARLFTMFYSYFNTQANLLRTEVTNTVRALGWRRGIGRLFYIYLFGMLIPAVVAEAIVQGARGELGDDEDDGLLDDMLELFVGAQARFVAAMVPIAGQFTTAAINMWNDVWYDDRLSTSPAVSAVERAARAPKSLYNALFDDGRAGTAVNDTLTAIGLITGLPLGQLGKPLAYAADVATGEQPAEDVGQVVRGVLSGRAEPRQ